MNIVNRNYIVPGYQMVVTDVIVSEDDPTLTISLEKLGIKSEDAFVAIVDGRSYIYKNLEVKAKS